MATVAIALLRKMLKIFIVWSSIVPSQNAAVIGTARGDHNSCLDLKEVTE